MGNRAYNANSLLLLFWISWFAASSAHAQSNYNAAGPSEGFASKLPLMVSEPAGVAVSQAPGAEAIQRIVPPGPGVAEPNDPRLFGLGTPEEWTQPERLSSSLQVMLLLTVISLAPAVLMMTTSFVRVIVVLGLLRQAMGTQQAPPGQVLTSLALFITLLLMSPVWKQSYDEGIAPYTRNEIGLEEAFERASMPIRRFMGNQIDQTGNEEAVWMFLRRLPDAVDPVTGQVTVDYVFYDAEKDERLVPLAALLPAYMLSELKTAFLIGFQVYLPFVIIDIVVASITISMGMLMLPPVLISLPFKLMLFVMVDGMTLTCGMLMESFVLT